MYGFEHGTRFDNDAVLFQMKHDARCRHNDEAGGEHSVNNAFMAFHIILIKGLFHNIFRFDG